MQPYVGYVLIGTSVIVGMACGSLVSPPIAIWLLGHIALTSSAYIVLVCIEKAEDAPRRSAAAWYGVAVCFARLGVLGKGWLLHWITDGKGAVHWRIASDAADIGLVVLAWVLPVVLAGYDLLPIWVPPGKRMRPRVHPP